MRSVKALTHRLGTMLDEQRRTSIAEYGEKVLHHETPCSSSRNKIAKILQEELLRQQQDFS